MTPPESAEPRTAARWQFDAGDCELVIFDRDCGSVSVTLQSKARDYDDYHKSQARGTLSFDERLAVAQRLLPDGYTIAPTEPRTAAQWNPSALGDQDILDELEIAIRGEWGNRASELRAELAFRLRQTRELAATAPDEPGRVVIDAQRLREIITSYLTPGSWPLTIHTAKDRDAWVGGIMANIERIAAAEHAATGGA